MQDEGVERYGGTKDVADSHKFDEKLEAYLAAHVRFCRPDGSTPI